MDIPVKLTTSVDLRHYFSDEKLSWTVDNFLSNQHLVTTEDMFQLPDLAERSAVTSQLRSELFAVLSNVFDGTFAERIRVHNKAFPRSALDFLDPSIAGRDEIAFQTPSEISVWDNRAIEGIVINRHRGGAWPRARIGVHVLPEGLLVLSVALRDSNQEPMPLEIPGWEDFADRQIFSVPTLNLAHGNEFDIEPLRKAAGGAIEVLSERLAWTAKSNNAWPHLRVVGSKPRSPVP